MFQELPELAANRTRAMCHASGREWELKVQEYEDEDEDEEPSVWTRVRSLLLILRLQLRHRLLKVREQLRGAARMLGGAAEAVRQPHRSVRSIITATIVFLSLSACSTALSLWSQTSTGWPPGAACEQQSPGSAPGNIWRFSGRGTPRGPRPALW